MTTLKIGNLSIDAREYDYRLKHSQNLDNPWELSDHERALVEHFSNLRHQKVLSFDCRTKAWVRHNADAQYRFLAKAELRVVGLDTETGEETQAASLALVNRYIARSGLGDPTAFGQQLTTLFGLHVKTIPFQVFAAKWVPRYSFDIWVSMHHHYLRLTIDGLGSPDLVVLAIPISLHFSANRTFDCSLDWSLEQPLTLDLPGPSTPRTWLDVPDRAARESMSDRMEKELERSKRLRTDLQESVNRLGYRVIEDPEDRFSANFLEQDSRRLSEVLTDIATIERWLETNGF